MTAKPAGSASLLRQFSAGERIFDEGDERREMFVLRSGRVRIFKKAGEGILTLAELGPGESFGEMAVLDRTVRSAAAEAVEDSELVVVGEDAFETMLAERSDIAGRLLRKLSARLREANRQIHLLTVHGSAVRVVETLRLWSQGREGAQIMLPKVTPDSLWQASGVKREVFGEVIHRLGEAGVALFSSEGLLIAWPQGLDDYIEYLDLKQSLDVHTRQELAALREIKKNPIDTPDEMALLAPVVGGRTNTQERFVELKQRFEPVQGA